MIVLQMCGINISEGIEQGSMGDVWDHSSPGPPAVFVCVSVCVYACLCPYI